MSGRAWGVRQCVPSSHGLVSVPTHLRPGLQSGGWSRSYPAQRLCAGPGGAALGYGFRTASPSAASRVGRVVAMISPHHQLWGGHRSPCPLHTPNDRGQLCPSLPRSQRMSPIPRSLCPQMCLLLPTSPPWLWPVLAWMPPLLCPRWRSLPRLPPSSQSTCTGRPAGPSRGWGSQETKGWRLAAQTWGLFIS